MNYYTKILIGIEKLKPESKDDIDTFEAPSFEDIRKDAVDEAIGRWIRSQCEDKLSDFLTDERLSNAKAVRFEIDENQLHPQHNSKWGIGGIFSAYFDRATAINNFGTDKVQKALDGEKIKCSLVCELG